MYPAFYQNRTPKLSRCSSRKKIGSTLFNENQEIHMAKDIPPNVEVLENIFLKDLDEPWRYFNEGIFK
jgi:hypothetical protein